MTIYEQSLYCILKGQCITISHAGSLKMTPMSFFPLILHVKQGTYSFKMHSDNNLTSGFALSDRIYRAEYRNFEKGGREF